MAGLENLETRLNYKGGANQQERMKHSKLDSLKKALLYSYQAATAILADGREFRCLINPDKLKNEYDDKIISIPFEDVCLNKEKTGTTTEGTEVIGMKCGDVFTWKETDSHWLVYLQRLEEIAYFRAEVRRCKYTIDVNGKSYYVYGKRLGEIDWNTKEGISWNDLDYTLQVYITKDEATQDFFERFKVVKINGEPWEVQAVDDISSDGLIIVAFKEYYSNSIEEAIEKENAEMAPVEPKPEPVEGEVYIEGYDVVYPYDELIYVIHNAEGGTWTVDSQKAVIVGTNTEPTVYVNIVTGRSGEFKLSYEREGQEPVVMDITIESL